MTAYDKNISNRWGRIDARWFVENPGGAQFTMIVIYV